MTRMARVPRPAVLPSANAKKATCTLLVMMREATTGRYIEGASAYPTPWARCSAPAMARAIISSGSTSSATAGRSRSSRYPVTAGTANASSAATT